jgi:hypothetical protein
MCLMLDIWYRFYRGPKNFADLLIAQLTAQLTEFPVRDQ